MESWIPYDSTSQMRHIYNLYSYFFTVYSQVFCCLFIYLFLSAPTLSSHYLTIITNLYYRGFQCVFIRNKQFIDLNIQFIQTTKHYYQLYNFYLKLFLVELFLRTKKNLKTSCFIFCVVRNLTNFIIMKDSIKFRNIKNHQFKS